MRLWRLARMSAAEVTADPFTRDPSFDLKRLPRRSFGTFQERPVDVALRFDARVAVDVAEFLFHPEQSMKRNANGSTTVRFTAAGVEEMCRHLVIWGTAVTVEPPLGCAGASPKCAPASPPTIERYRDPPPSQAERPVTAAALPDHLRRFPCMHPWIVSRYRDERHKRLLVIGESHYLPPESTIHHDPAHWYRSRADLTEEEARWTSSIGNITGRWTRAHRIYRAIQDEIVRNPDGKRDHAGPLPPQPHRLLQLLPAAGPGGRGSMQGNMQPGTSTQPRKCSDGSSYATAPSW